MTKTPPPESSKKSTKTVEKEKEGSSRKVEHNSKGRKSLDVAGSSGKPPIHPSRRSKSLGLDAAQKEKSEERESGEDSGLSVKQASNEREGRSPVKKDSKKKKNRSLTTGSSQEKKKRSAERDSTDGDANRSSLEGAAIKEKRSLSERDRSEAKNKQSVKRKPSKEKSKPSRTRDYSMGSEEPSSSKGPVTQEPTERDLSKKNRKRFCNSDGSTDEHKPDAKRVPNNEEGSSEPTPTKITTTKHTKKTAARFLSEERSHAEDQPTSSKKLSPSPARGISKGTKKRSFSEGQGLRNQSPVRDLTEELTKLSPTTKSSSHSGKKPSKDGSTKRNIQIPSKDRSRNSEPLLDVNDTTRVNDQLSPAAGPSKDGEGSSSVEGPSMEKQTPSPKQDTTKKIKNRSYSTPTTKKKEELSPAKTHPKKNVEPSSSKKKPWNSSPKLDKPSAGPSRSPSINRSTDNKDLLNSKDSTKGKKKSTTKKYRSKSEGEPKNKRSGEMVLSPDTRHHTATQPQPWVPRNTEVFVPALWHKLDNLTPRKSPEE
ncbi:hypothetical protein CAEBREN_23946 [Caenorhabditis brenneri]|uniref:Uncharacterized protein n=1 Tax=Caenorhabditis brenneri TaxID=135651 RepID=G0NN65_CAEBE|nr:hypothetical protein CAEBREN_23946 [Caenorhabditis brenneri]